MGSGTTGEITLNVCVEFEDVDAYRIVHHTRLIAYLERAHVRLVRQLGLDVLGGDVAPVLYDMKVHFRKPAMLFDNLEVTVRITGFDGFRLALRYRIRKDGETIMRARNTIAFYDRRCNCAVEAPQECQEAFAECLHVQGDIE